MSSTRIHEDSHPRRGWRVSSGSPRSPIRVPFRYLHVDPALGLRSRTLDTVAEGSFTCFLAGSEILHRPLRVWLPREVLYVLVSPPTTSSGHLGVDPSDLPRVHLKDVLPLCVDEVPLKVHPPPYSFPVLDSCLPVFVLCCLSRLSDSSLTRLYAPRTVPVSCLPLQPSRRPDLHLRS